jgi:hypothetical protein
MTRLLLLPPALLAAVLSLSLARGQAPEPGRTFTLQRKGLTLGEALKELTRQTGVTVANETGQKNGRQFDLDCKGLPFWKALDAIAAASGTRVYLYQADGGVALVSRLGGKVDALPVSYHGFCRTTVKHLTVNSDLETGSRTCAVQLDVAWEPGFTAFILKAEAARVAFAPDAWAKVVKADVPAQGKYQITPPACAQEVTLRTRAPDRSSPAIGTLKGDFVLIGAQRMVDFTFDKLRPLRTTDKAVEQTRQGVRARLIEVRVQPDPAQFLFRVVIDIPPGTPTFESYEKWLDYNPVWLEKKGVRLAGETMVERGRPPKAVLRYTFRQKGNRTAPLGRLSDWTLHFRTPERVVEVRVPYEFKNVPLP